MANPIKGLSSLEFAVIFPRAPIVFCAIDKTELGNRVLPPHVRGILWKRELVFYTTVLRDAASGAWLLSRRKMDQ
jgi:hypothetical protein